jgi:hypothetical protein
MIMKNFLFLMILVALASCSVPEKIVKKYDPLTLNAVALYMPKPTSFDSVKSKNYISGGIYQISPIEKSGKSNLEDVIFMGDISYSRAHIYDKFNFAYGLDAFLGSYKNNFIQADDPNYFKSKSVGGFQLKTSINTFRKYKKCDFRYIGVDLAYMNESGDYKNFRNQINKNPFYYSIPNSGFFTAGINSEVIFNNTLGKKSQLGIKLSLLKSFGDFTYLGVDNNGGKNDGVTGVLAFFLKKNNYFIVLEGPGFAKFNVGFTF